MPTALVAFHSRTTHTRMVAEAIAAALPAHLEPVAELGEGSAGVIREPLTNPADYRLVILGSPVWAGRLAAPLRTYIKRFRHRLPAVAFFCTETGYGSDRVFREMNLLCERAPLVRLAITEAEIQDNLHLAKIDAFVAELRRHLQTSSAAQAL